MQMHHSSPPTNPSDLSLLPVLPLLALFDCAGDEPLPRFERQALRLLAEALDCDGAVWGWGRREGGAMRIRHAVVHQRPDGLLSDYAAVRSTGRSACTGPPATPTCATIWRSTTSPS